jgi:uncharacterized RDD family membrane protein YckC
MADVAAPTRAPARRASERRTDRESLEGSYAGAVSRLVAYVIDVFVISTSFAIGAAVFEYVASVVLPIDIDLNDVPIVSGVALAVWSFVYFAYPLATTGRTLGKAIVGLRVVRADGSDLGGWRAAVRVLAMPLSFVLCGLGLVPILVRKDRRALHDLIAGSAEVYWWRPRLR